MGTIQLSRHVVEKKNMFDLNLEGNRFAHEENRPSNMKQIVENSSTLDTEAAISMLRESAKQVELAGRVHSQQRCASECLIAGRVLDAGDDAFDADDGFAQMAESYYFFNFWSLSQHMREYADFLEGLGEWSKIRDIAVGYGKALKSESNE